MDELLANLDLSFTINTIVFLILTYLLFSVHNLRHALRSTINTLLSIDRHLDRLVNIYEDKPEKKHVDN